MRNAFRNLSWKMGVLSLFVLAIGVAGCGSGGTTCSYDFLDSSTQEICDNQAAPFGCDIPAQWSAATQFCTGVNCTVCGGSGTE